VAAALLEKQGLTRHKNFSPRINARKEKEESGSKVVPVFASRIATVKPSATRRAVADPLLAPPKAREVSDFPQNAARASNAARTMAREREEARRGEARRYDLARPISLREEERAADDFTSKAAAKPTHFDAELVEMNRKGEPEDYAVTCTKFHENLKATGKQLFFVEPPREKKLFYWENHLAPMELMTPVAVDVYSKLNRANGWKSAKQKQQEKMCEQYVRRNGDGESENKNENMPSNIFEESDEGVYPEHIVVKTHSLGPVRNLYQETISSVFDPLGR